MPRSEQARRGPSLLNPAEGPAFKEPKGHAPPPVREVGSEDVIKALRSVGKGWTDDIGEMLGLPSRLFMESADDATYYSADRSFGIKSILSSFRSDSVDASATDYGIALYSSGSSVYFVFADLKRRLVVRERMFCFHENPPERDWSAVKERLSAALSMAGSDSIRNGGLIVVSDQYVRPMRLAQKD
jgi:hypothetical protein